MIRSQSLLQRERGISATALPDVIAHSGAPRGSIYHHFPNGRVELAEEATRYAAEWVESNLAQALACGDVVAAHRVFVESWLAILRESDFRAGCAVAAGALDAPRDSPSTRSAAAAFERWERLLRDSYQAAGIPPSRAEALAVTSISAIEGALIVCRSQSSTRPLELVGAQLEHVLTEELAAALDPR